MAECEDLQSWAVREGLPPEVTATLKEQGFTTVDQLKTLTPDDIKECFQDSGLLKMAQCLALKKAVARLSQTSSGPAAQHHPYPFSTPPQSYPSPSYPNSSVPQPYSSASHLSSADPQAYRTPSAPTLSAPEAYSSASHPNVVPQPFRKPPAPYPITPEQWQTQPQPYSASQPGYPGSAASHLGASPYTGADRTDGGAGECFRFLLLGKTGSGKSTTGNTIFGQRLFDTAATFSSVTSECERKTCVRNGRKVEIIDSPGLYDTHKTQEEICVIIVQAVAGMHPGPHAILYVVRLGRYTAEDLGAYQRLKALFDNSITKYLIVVFTYGDMLEREGRSIEDLIRSDTPEGLRQVLKECDDRYVVFNNMASDTRPQVEQLLQKVRHMVTQNGGQPYSCPKYGQIGAGMEDEVARRLQEVEKRDLKRQKYVQQLERQTKEAEETAKKSKEQFEKKERERQRLMEEEKQKRQRVEDELQNQLKQQQQNSEKHRQELHRLQGEMKEQARMMKEKEHEMTERERKRAEEEAEKMRQLEREMQAMMKMQEEAAARQREEDEARRQQLDQERQEFVQQMEEQRRKDKEELERKEEEREKLWEQQLQEELAAAKTKAENYEKEMEKLKQQVVNKENDEFINTAVKVVGGVAILAISLYFKV